MIESYDILILSTQEQVNWSTGKADSTCSVSPWLISGGINLTSNFKSAKIWIVSLFHVDTMVGETVKGGY